MIMKKHIIVLPIIMILTSAVLPADIFWSSEEKLEANDAGTAEISAYWNLEEIQGLTEYDVWFEGESDSTDGGYVRLEDNAVVSMGGTSIQGKGTFGIGWDITSFGACNIFLSASGAFENDEKKTIDWEAEWKAYGTETDVVLGSIDGSQPYTDEKLIYQHNPQKNQIHSTGSVPFTITTANYEISNKENDIYRTYLYITIKDNTGSQL